MNPLPFLVVLARCSDGHWEVNTAEAFLANDRGNVARICVRCHGSLTLVREAMVVPGRSHADMPCYGKHVLEPV